MDEYKISAISDILSSGNTYAKIKKFELYRDKLGECKIYLFDEENSNLGSSFKNFELGIYGIYGIGDYTKTWIMDPYHDLKRTYLQVGKTLDFDLNIFTYLHNIMQGRNMEMDKAEAIEYFNYIKDNTFQCGIATALMERVTKPISQNILAEMLMSFVRFDKINHIAEKSNDIYLNIDDYKRVKEMYEMALSQSNKEIKQYDMVCCCVMKAYLIKNCEKTLEISKKVDNFINYCLQDLCCYMEKEIVLLALYIMNDDRTKETFKKLNKISKIEQNILNVAWDIYHIRLIEQIMLYDNKKTKEQTILSYFATADKGLTDAMKINPLKAFVIIDNIPVAIHSITVEDVCQNQEILQEIRTKGSIRNEKMKRLNFSKIRQELQKEIYKLQLSLK